MLNLPNFTAIALFGIDLWYYGLCSVGSFLLYSLMRTKGRKVIQFISHLDERLAGRPSVQIAEMVLFSIIGGIVGSIITHPVTPLEALLAGVGWTGTVGVLVGEKDRSDKEDD